MAVKALGRVTTAKIHEEVLASLEASTLCEEPWDAADPFDIKEGNLNLAGTVQLTADDAGCITHATRLEGTNTITTKESPMKRTMNKMLDTNKEAAHIAAKLTAGKVSNNFVLGKLMGSFPWYTKLFAKKKDFSENPVAKLVTAQTAAAAIAHFAPDNAKLAYISEAMVQDALLDVTYNSELLENMVAELENIVKLPGSFTLDPKSK